MQEEERRTGKDAAAAAAAAAPGNSRNRAPPSAQRRGPGPRAGRRPESASAPAAGRRPRGAVENSGPRGPCNGKSPSPLSPPRSPTRQPSERRTPAQSPQVPAGQSADRSLERKAALEQLGCRAAAASGPPAPAVPAFSRQPPSPTSPSKSASSAAPAAAASAQAPSNFAPPPHAADGRPPTTPAASRGPSPPDGDCGPPGYDDVGPLPYRRPRAVSLSADGGISEFQGAQGPGSFANNLAHGGNTAANLGLCANRSGVWNGGGVGGGPSSKLEGPSAGRRTSFAGLTEYQAAYAAGDEPAYYGGPSSSVSLGTSQHPPGAPYGRRSSAVLAEGPDLTRMDGIPPQFGFRGLPSMSEESELCTGGALPSDHTSFTLPRLRLRSKSSAAAYGIGPPGVMNDRRFSLGAPGYDRDGLDAGVAPLASDVYGSNDEQLQEGSRRRSVTNPADYWLHAHDGEGDLAGQSAAGEPFERVRPRRRLSLHPSFTGYGGASAYQAGGFGSVAAGGELGGAGQYGDYSHLESSQGMGTLNRMVEPEFGHHNQRRHSVSGPTLSFANPSQARYLGDVMESLRIDDANLYGRQPQGMIPMPPDSSRDNYADDDESRAAAAASPAIPNTVPSPVRSSPKELHPGPAATAASSDSVMHLGKGIPLHAVPHAGPLYIVEFKAGRSDLFYLVPEAGDLKIKRGDLVIVEADRGKDLGKVVSDNITPVQVQMLQQQQAEAAAVAEMGMVNKDPKNPAAAAAQQPQPQQQLQVKDLHPKRLYRLAQPAEVTMLVAKSQDETKSMLVCQAKVRQKNLPMAVVDAEYQWDRHKLTFYFIAERRIDFRELVRELFKIYKTRIWMCAVNPGHMSNAGSVKT